MKLYFDKDTRAVRIIKHEGEYLFIKNGIDVTVRENKKSKTYKFNLRDTIKSGTVAVIFKVNQNHPLASSIAPYGIVYSISYDSNKSELSKKQVTKKDDASLIIDRLTDGCSDYNIQGLRCTYYA